MKHVQEKHERLDTSGLVALLVSLLMLVASPATAQEVDAELELGQKFKGEILHNSDIDVVRFPALQSSLVSITIEGSSKLAPAAMIANAATGAVIDTAQFEKGAGSKKLQLKKVPIPKNGIYELRIRTGNFELGKYSVSTKVKHPNTLTQVKTFLNMQAGETREVKFSAAPGTKITGSVKGLNGQFSLPSITTLNTPTGAKDISGFIVTKGKKVKLKKIFAESLGEHALLVQNVGEAGEIFVDLDIEPKKAKKATFQEPIEPKDPGSIAGKVSVADVPALVEQEPNDSIQDTEFVGLSLPGKLIRITGDTTDNGFPGGMNGQPLSSADLDSFRIAVENPQAVHINLIHGVENDFDIGVWDVLAGQWVGFIESSLEPEVGAVVVTPPTGQTMLLDVIVYSYAGSGSYILTLNAAPPPQTAAGGADEEEPTAYLQAPEGKGVAGSAEGTDHYLQLDRDFVDGEFIVRLNDDHASVHEFATGEGLFVRIASPTGPAVVRVPNLESLDERARRRATVQAKERLRSHPAVRYTQLNFIYQPTAIPNDPNYAQQWHYPTMNLPQAWDITKGSPNVIVAVLDTGIVAHPDLVSRDSGFGYDMISNPLIAVDGDGMDPDPTDPGDKKSANEKSSWHGTHVAGTIGAATNNGNGVAGVDWNCRLMHVRVLGKGGGTTFDIDEGIKYAARVANASGALPQQRANIINMSLGGDGAPGPATQEAINLARAQGVVIFAASGNDNVGGPQDPASAIGVIAVGAVGQAEEKAYYSNYGSYLDIAAPGGDFQKDSGVLSTLVDDKTNAYIVKAYQGTSMATPHAAGLCALMFSVNPNLTPDQAESILTSTAKDLGAPGRDDLYGYGLIDAFKAVQAAGGGANPTLSLSTTALDYGKAINSLTVKVSNAGGGTLTWNAADNADWLTITPTNGGPSEVTATVDRAGLQAGLYNAQISFTSNGGAAQVAVSMEVGTGTGPANMTLSTESLNFGGTETTLKVTIGNTGGEALNWSAADAEIGGGNWLAISPTAGTVNALQSQEMTVTVNRTGLAQGAYAGTITFNANGNTAQKVVAVSMNVPQGTTPILSLGATVAPMGAVLTSFPVVVANAGGGTLTFAATDTENGGGTWLSVTPGNGTAPSTITIQCDRTGLAPGSYSGVVDVTSNGGNAQVAVSMEVLPQDIKPLDLGDVYVLAVDPVTFETRGQSVTTQYDGNYSMGGIPVGLYLMVAGPDLDGDFTICGVGEPCGVYPVLNNPTLLDLTGGQILVGIDFVVAPDLTIPTSAGGGGFTPPEGGFRVLPDADSP